MQTSKMLGPLFALIAAVLVTLAKADDVISPSGYDDGTSPGYDIGYDPKRGDGYGSTLGYGSKPGDGYGSTPGYGFQGFGYPPRNLQYELIRAQARVRNLAGNDRDKNEALDDVMEKINQATSNRREFLSNTLPALKASMAGQESRIASLTATLKAQSALLDDVNQLRAKVESLVTNLEAARENNRQITADLVGLLNTEREQRIAISNITAEATIQDIRLNEAEGRITENENDASTIYNSLIQVVNVVNNEQAYVFTAELRQGESVRFEFDNAFSDTPYINYAVKGFHVTEDGSRYAKDYKYDKDEQIAPQLSQVSLDSTGVEVRADGDQKGWGDVKIFACILAYYIDNTQLEFPDEYQPSPPPPPPPTTTKAPPPPPYQPGPGPVYKPPTPSGYEAVVNPGYYQRPPQGYEPNRRPRPRRPRPGRRPRPDYQS